MRTTFGRVLFLLTVFVAAGVSAAEVGGEVRAWEGTITLPTYGWEEDVNPRLWALDGEIKLGAGGDPIVYPYVMQDFLGRQKADRTYKALFLENEYLKVTCLPELGGRLHSVWDKTQGKEMFHLNHVIKPGMIAMRGAWISGGVEWNTGPHGHTATILSPVSAMTGKDPDGSAYLEISNLEQIFRTRWTVRLTLHPGRAYLDERIRMENPTDGMRPYYFWNCTAFPNRPGTRFIFPMSLGTDHSAKEFFHWPVNDGKDLSWLKNYDMYHSIFAVNCTHDFFGAYDTGTDRGVVQWANHNELGGKKAWTWGEWEFGKVAEKNLTDDDGPYIEVQSGPLPTQSDYGMLAPHDVVTWQEWWYPVHGLGNGFEYATRDVAAQTSRHDGLLEVRLLATAEFPQAECALASEGRQLGSKKLDLTPNAPVAVALPVDPQKPVEIRVTSKDGQVLAAFTSPLPIPQVDPPDRARLEDKPDDQLSVEELFLKGRKFDRATDRRKARESYEKVLARDPGHTASLRSLAVLDFEAGLYEQAIEKLKKALQRDSDDGLAWFYQGMCNFQLCNFLGAQRCGYRATRCPCTVSLGYDLVGRAAIRLDKKEQAVAAFRKAVETNPDDRTAADHLALALYASGKKDEARQIAQRRLDENPTADVPRMLLWLQNPSSARFPSESHYSVGDEAFQLHETSLIFAEFGLESAAGDIATLSWTNSISSNKPDFMSVYYRAWYDSLCGKGTNTHQLLASAANIHEERMFASRPEEIEILRYALKENPGDAQANLQLGCLLAHMGRVDEAVPLWEKAVALDPKSSIAWRNLGLAAAMKNDLAKSESQFQKAIAARPSDQTLYRDLASVFTADGKRPEAIRLLETMPREGMRRADVTLMLAQDYVDERRYEDCIKLLEAAPYFVNWEGQDVTWRLFNRAHIERGRQRLDNGDANGALADFEVALTYPSNLNVGRSNKPEEAQAQYWRGKALAALGHTGDARTAWQSGADGADVTGTQNEYRQKCREAIAGENK